MAFTLSRHVLTAILASAFSATSYALPTIEELNRTAKSFLRTQVLNNGEFQIELKTAEAHEYYHVDRFFIYGRNEVVPAIVGIYTVKRQDGQAANFSLLFDESGSIVPGTMAATYIDQNQRCMPYFFHALGKYSLYFYPAKPDADLWKLRVAVMDNLVATMKRNKMPFGLEWITTQLVPNPWDVQWIKVDGQSLIALYERDVQTLVTSQLQVPEARNLFADISRIYAPELSDAQQPPNCRLLTQ